MRNFLIGLVFSVMLTGAAAAQEPLVPAKDFPWPTSAQQVKVNGIDLAVEWVDGRPKALKSDLEKLLHRKITGARDGVSVDLIDALIESGYLVRRGHSNEIDARNPNNAASSVQNPGSRRTPTPAPGHK